MTARWFGSRPRPRRRNRRTSGSTSGGRDSYQKR
jgi:hypothetical protein